MKTPGSKAVSRCASENVVPFPQASAPAQHSTLTQEQKQRVVALFAAIRVEHDAEVRRQRKRMPVSLRPLDRATRRLAKAAHEMLDAVDVARAEAGLSEL